MKNYLKELVLHPKRFACIVCSNYLNGVFLCLCSWRATLMTLGVFCPLNLPIYNAWELPRSYLLLMVQ